MYTRPMETTATTTAPDLATAIVVIMSMLDDAVALEISGDSAAASALLAEAALIADSVEMADPMYSAEFSLGVLEREIAIMFARRVEIAQAAR